MPTSHASPHESTTIAGNRYDPERGRHLIGEEVFGRQSVGDAKHTQYDDIR